MNPFSVIFSALFLVLSCSGLPQQGLLTDWTLQQEGAARKYQVTVPCTVAGALNQGGALGKDLFIEDHYKDIDKALFDKPWVYTTRFAAHKGQCQVLRFEGLNFRADIELNGHCIASADTTAGTFSVREFDITPYTKRKNTLKVTVYRPQSGELNTGFADWNPRPMDESMGIIRPVELIATPDVEVEDVYVRPVVNPDCLQHAEIKVNILVRNRSSRAVDGTVCGTYEDGQFTIPVQLEAGECKQLTISETVENPRIWWTREMGTPELYHLSVSFRKGEKVSHGRSVTFGIRDIRSEVDALGHRQFILNGRKVLVKAGGWSDDIFLQDTPESLKAQIEMVADMGLNCIRFENIWGKDDCVYDLCDSLGILTLVGWSCQWEWKDYCGLEETKGYGCINDPVSEAFAVRYFHDQLIRLRNHPSLIGWMVGSDRIPNPRLEEQYLSLYKALDYRPYVCSAKGLTSLAGPSGMKMEGPYEYVGPDYWWVDTHEGGAFGFNTETGPGLNIPQMENLRRMVGEKDLWPIGPNWAFHCTASASHMNNTSVQEAAMKGIYGEATDVYDYVRKAHALDYDSERAMFEAFRGNLPRTTGIVQWMLNSAWPSLYWQFYDWYGIPTAGYYGVKNACRPVQLVYNYADGCIYVVNDVVPEARVEAVMRVFGPDSRLQKEEHVQTVSREREPQKVFGPVEGDCFLSLELSGDTEAHNFYCLSAKPNVYNWKKSQWWGMPFLDYTDLHYVSALPEAAVKAELPGDGTIVLQNISDVVAYQNILKAKDAEGQLIPGTFFSDNFFALYPGECRTIRCTLPEGCTDASLTLEGWNIKSIVL